MTKSNTCPACGSKGVLANGAYNCTNDGCDTSWTAQEGLTRTVDEEPIHHPLPR